MLLENIERLNKFYKHQPFFFRLVDGVVKFVEEIPYYLSKHPDLKKRLQKGYKLVFNKTSLWHLGSEGIDILSKKLLKLETSLSFDELKRKLYYYINAITNPALQKAVKKLLEQVPEFIKMPASMYYHHAYKHGLLEHSIQVVEYALACRKVSFDKDVIDKDILIVGGLLHDIGKSHVYLVNDNVATASSIMIHQDHLFHGGLLVERYLKDDELDRKIVDQILHIIASHHVTKIWGTIVEPKTFEAWIIGQSDNLSAKIGG